MASTPTSRAIGLIQEFPRRRSLQPRQPSSVIDNVIEDIMLDDEKERMVIIAKSMAEELLQVTDVGGGIPWCPTGAHHDKSGISLYHAEVEESIPCNTHAACTFACELDVVAESMVTSTTQSYKTMMHMLSSDFLDGAIIQNIVHPTEAYPHRHVALKWGVFKRAKLNAKDRDVTVLEYVDLIDNEHGQKVAFRIMKSVDVPMNSKYSESKKIQYSRDIIPLMGFLYHSTGRPEELRMTYTCNFDKENDLPVAVRGWAVSTMQCHVQKCITGVLKYIQTFQEKKEAIRVPRQHVITMNKSGSCGICEKIFGIFTTPYHCVKCGEITCKSCSSLRAVQVPVLGERQLRVCKKCIIEARRNSKELKAATAAAAVDANEQSVLSSPAPKIQNDFPNEASCSGTTYLSSSRIDNSQHGWSLKASIECYGPPSATSSNEDEADKVSATQKLYAHILEPVKSRLLNYKTFSADVESPLIPRGAFPARGFSDGLIGTVFRRRGSPADLTKSVRNFHKTMLPQSPSTENSESVGFSSDDEDNNEKDDNLKSPNINSQLCIRCHCLSSPTTLSQLSICSEKEELRAAMELAPLIIQAAQTTNNLAKRVRKISHHRILALQHEEAFLRPRISNDTRSNGVNSMQNSRITTQIA